MTTTYNDSNGDGENLMEYSKGDVAIAMLEHVGYEREIGEAHDGALHKSHLRALIEHCREHLPVAQLVRQHLDETAQLGVELGLSELEDCSATELRLLLSAICDAGFRDRVFVDENGVYRARAGSTSTLRQDELVAIYRIVMDLPAAQRGGDHHGI